MSLLTTTSVPSSLSPPDSPVAPRLLMDPVVAMHADDQADSSLDLTRVLTLVLWTGCLLIGVLGFVLPYDRPRPPARMPKPVAVEKLMVDLANETLPQTAQPSDALAAPPRLTAPSQPQIAQPIAVAEPTAVAFAVPVEGPTVRVAVAQATHRASSLVSPRNVGLPTPQTLVFGEGEGRQPAPQYPARSAKLGQEGIVSVRLTVDTNGRVIDTLVATPCAWPLLNDAAERTVRHRWRFPRGPLRIYEVAIHFALAR